MKLAYILLFALLTTPSHSADLLQIMPTRVLFDGNMRAADVFLRSGGDSSGNYRIFLRNMRMSENGKTEIIKGERLEGEMFADKMIRYSPRRVKISKNENHLKQTIRLALRKPKNLEDGEYRTHMIISSIPDAVDLSDKTNNVLTATVEISIPIIVRKGLLAASVDILDVKYNKSDKGNHYLTFNLNRKGNRSIYGNIEITHKSKETTNKVTRMIGIANYLPFNKRIVRAPLEISDAPKKGDKFIISFSENPEYGGSEKAQTIFTYE